MYSIVDIETTGNGIIGNRITEIAIFKFDGERIVEEFVSLVNPECDIPYFITGLTGIDNDMVRNAPRFAEIALRIREITHDTVFVAHSVNFDYHVIKQEFRSLGEEFSMKKLCTVRLSRRMFPGLYSYSLGKLCASLGLPLTNRHRAGGDARATVRLFEKILQAEGAEAVLRSFLNARSQEATLPPGLSRKAYEELPPQPGIYLFKDDSGRIIYVGKAKNIKKRVLSHFYDLTDREVQMCMQTAAIDFELSGNELVALLMESAAIKRHFPPYNRSQKRSAPQYAIFWYEDRNGILHLAYNRLRAVPSPLLIFSSTSDCRLYLENVCEAHGLCPKYCHLQEAVRNCFHFRLKSCGGICRGTESAAAYNAKVRTAIEGITVSEENRLIRERGRTADEDAVILVQDGIYYGYGFVPKACSAHSLEDILGFITPQKNTPETQRLLHSYMAKHPENLMEFPVSSA